MSGEQLFFNAKVYGFTRRETLNDKEHLVVPVVAAKVGVMNDLFYSEEELSAFSESWNGVPVPVAHPFEEGKYVTANSPTIENTQNIGKFYNVVFEDQKLKGEIWIDLPKSLALNFKDVIDRLESGDMVEVSTGLTCETILQNGVFNGVPYKGVVSHIMPDHLALLPNTIGACSIKDGCGAMRANSNECECKKTSLEKMKDALSLVGEKFGLQGNQLTFSDIREQIQTLLRQDNQDIEEVDLWVTDITDTFFVYEQGSKLFKQGYSIFNDKVSLAVGAQEVTRITSFEVVANSKNIKKGDINMKKTDLVKSIIENKANSFSVSDSDVLSAMDEAILAKLVANDEGDESKESDEAEPKAEVKKDAVEVDAEKTTDQKADEVVGNTQDPETREFLANAIAAQKAEKVRLIEYIKANSKLLDSDLSALNLASLNRYAETFQPEASYTGRGGSLSPKVNSTYKPKPILLPSEDS